ncbi:MAG TPA: hypothetical protein VMZ53_13975 [Kofleriaceae bacterium]|nr:hypothetical protein [Kofleriaceae bacterium]
MELSPCPACKRHVRIAAASCPFCATRLPVLQARRAIPRSLTRAAIFSAALAGCQTKQSAPAPSAGSAAPIVAPPAPVADAADMPITGSNAGSAVVADDASVAADAAAAGSGVGSALRQEKLHRLKEKRTQHIKIPDERQMAKPYGAPPARRRVV